MQLFLSGGGSSADSAELDKKFIASVAAGKPVLYIPIAINTEKYPYSGCLAWIQKNFRHLGFDNFVMWIEEDLKGKREEDFKQFGGVYIGGGNTFKLLKELKEFGTAEILKHLAARGIPIYGGSAGAIILTRSIIPALSADENLVGLTDFSALSLLRGFDIWCHYAEGMEDEIRACMRTNRIEKIIAIPESAGLYVTDGGIEAVGPSDVTVFAKDSKGFVKSGEMVG